MGEYKIRQVELVTGETVLFPMTEIGLLRYELMVKFLRTMTFQRLNSPSSPVSDGCSELSTYKSHPSMPLGEEGEDL